MNLLDQLGLLTCQLLQLRGSTLAIVQSFLQLERERFLPPLCSPQVLLLFMQGFGALLILLGRLRDLLLVACDGLIELVQPSDDRHVVHQLLTVPVNLLELESLIESTKVRLLLGPAGEVQVTKRLRIPVALLKQRAGPNPRYPVLDSGGYRFAGTGDFNYDGKTDIIWHNGSAGDSAVWFMDGVTMVYQAPLDPRYPVPDSSGWLLAGN